MNANLDALAADCYATFVQPLGWGELHRRVFGPDGLIERRLSPDERSSFEATDDFAKLQELLADRRAAPGRKASADQVEKMITVRLPESMHDQLLIEADRLSTSMNKLAIAKLLQPVSSRYVPADDDRRRGRRRKRSRRPTPNSK